MSNPKDFAETLVEALYMAWLNNYETGANHDSKNAAAIAFKKAESDVLQALRVPSPHSEDFPDMRDQFAMAALPACIEYYRTNENRSRRDACEEAYEWADKMLAARVTSTPEGVKS